jgi:hypothetical protein
MRLETDYLQKCSGMVGDGRRYEASLTSLHFDSFRHYAHGYNPSDFAALVERTA